jgi:hypothetical protein
MLSASFANSSEEEVRLWAKFAIRVWIDFNINGKWKSSQTGANRIDSAHSRYSGASGNYRTSAQPSGDGKLSLSGLWEYP